MKLLAITACTAGVAHTYMAAKFLEKAAKKKGYEIKVEKQGANGIEDRITAQDVAEADGIIYATDVGVAEKERFENLPSVHCKVAYAIKHSDEMVEKIEAEAAASDLPKAGERAVASAGATTSDDSNDNVVMKFLKDWYGGALSGVSHIIPLVIIGGLTVGLLNLFFGYDYTHLYNEALLNAAGSSYDALGIGAGGLDVGSKEAIKAVSDITVPYAQGNPEFATSLQGIVHYLYYIALKAFNPLLVCVLAAFTAYGMVGKPGLAPGFVGGYVAMGGSFGKLSVVSGGFIGGLVAGAAAALFVMLLRKVKVPEVLESVKTLILVPFIAGILTILFMLIGPGKFFAFLNSSLTDWLNSLSGANLLVLGFILGCMSNFDMGGPINKAAYLFCIGAGTNGNTEFYAAFTAAKCIPGMSLGLMSTLFPRFFDKEDQAAGVSTAILGFCGITEGAIPYAVKDPLRVIPAQMIGGGVAAALILSSKITIGTVAGGAVFMLPVISEPWLWLTYFVIGVAVAMAGTLGMKTFWKRDKAVTA